MSGFDRVIVVDWSASKAPSPKVPSADAIWIAVQAGGQTTCTYHRTRADAMATLCAEFDAAILAGQRVLAGFDFPFGYPAGFARAVTGTSDPLALWGNLAKWIKDADDNANNRFEVAGDLNRLFPGVGPFWGCPAAIADDVLPAKGSARHGHGMTERRKIETLIASAQPCWKLYTTGSVGSQALLGIARLQGLRERYGAALSVAPFEAPDTPIVLAEVYPSLLAAEIAARQGVDEIKDRAQVRVTAQALAGVPGEQMDVMLREGDTEEGWILGVGHEDALRASLERAPVPPLKNDCFALPPGVHWTPVDKALADLRQRLGPVVGSETAPVNAALNRVLAAHVIAPRAHPPLPNTAVDGYGFAGGKAESVHDMPVIAAQMTAGRTPDFEVPSGSAVRILTGAALPGGVDTVILQEDVQRTGGRISFHGPIKAGANTRAAGEDVETGACVVSAGRRLTPADLALLSAVGVGTVSVRAPLRVGVLSTGDELVAPGSDAGPGQIYDANRPMLLGLIDRLGHVGIDLGHVNDDRTALSGRFDDAAARVDVIVTSGGASAGDEDHVSALLNASGHMALWRIAIKPGRPLALGMWQGVPVFGLPGNPVAAMVCTLVFAAPALAQMAGAGWSAPQGFDVPAGFEKRKKAGRREFLRARTRDGRVEVFQSEGSGRISGLSWAEGLVELPDDALHVRPGDPVRFIPWSGFGA
ncbi:gephyrin-like molybdotransferase Glp [Tateyamaria sp. Alg231-49]|uniref:molybdopterin-binding protein n=1 Tax=Tateyamaria sp. Alg231-49 TaxID=1922219 RepID=UPI000D55D1E4|nr:gephyrin-like molybdotransferase Glp [Tateyamaria sp. Alg231-49]